MTQTRLEHDLLSEREVPIECYYRILTERCITGITANREVCRHMVEHSIGLVTALNPYVVTPRPTLPRLWWVHPG
jgi:aspartate ammonia-lyase